MEASPHTLTAVPSPAPYEQCEHCAAPVDTAQRYCVACGTHRRHVRDPASRYLAARVSRARTAAAAPGSRSPKPSSSLLTALLLAVIPLAIGLGVLVGRSSNNGDAKLLAALRNQRGPVASSASGPGTAATSTGSRTVTSTFPLQHGYAVELQTLPSSGATTAQISSAESAARAGGAKNVGLIVQSQYTVTPSPPAGAYVIYDGAYKTRAAATGELSKLKIKFHRAVVIQVKSTSSATSLSGGGKVLARTKYGTAHQVTGFHASKAQLNQGGALVKKIQKTLGKSYVGAQRGLPDQISVP